MEEPTVVEELAIIITKYMEKFSLEVIDISHLAGSTKKTINALLDNSGSIRIETADSLAKAFGLRYYTFCNPDNPIPSLQSLPERTQTRIGDRKRNGPSVDTNYVPREINHQIRSVIIHFNENEDFTAEDIAKKIFSKYAVAYEPKEITNRLNLSLMDTVIDTGRKDTNKKGNGRKPKIYRLKK